MTLQTDFFSTETSDFLIYFLSSHLILFYKWVGRQFFLNCKKKILKIGTYYTISIIVLKWNKLVYNAVVYQKDADRMTHSVNPDQTAPEQSDLGLHCLLRPICPNI